MKLGICLVGLVRLQQGSHDDPPQRTGMMSPYAHDGGDLFVLQEYISLVPTVPPLFLELSIFCTLFAYVALHFKETHPTRLASIGKRIRRSGFPPHNKLTAQKKLVVDRSRNHS